MKEKVILAYSGGLDTTAIIPWLKENFDYEVICVCVDCGQDEELDGLEERAISCGASKLYIEDVTDEFCDKYIVPCVQAGAVYENNIPKLVAEYKGAITIQGGLDNGKYDMPDWTDEKVRAGLKAHIEACGPKYIIHALTMGGPETTYPGLYERVSEIIAEFDPIYFPQK